MGCPGMYPMEGSTVSGTTEGSSLRGSVEVLSWRACPGAGQLGGSTLRSHKGFLLCPLEVSLGCTFDGVLWRGSPGGGPLHGSIGGCPMEWGRLQWSYIWGSPAGDPLKGSHGEGCCKVSLEWVPWRKYPGVGPLEGSSGSGPSFGGSRKVGPCT
jgi:hypothetical protein